ncbi:MAG: hypothetical protein AAF762_01425 [Pseudomonadota bacterium]
MTPHGPLSVLRKGAVLFIALFAAVASAQAQQPAPNALSLELNTVGDVEGACRLTFLVGNEMPTDISGFVVEAVIFNTDGQVDRLTLFDFQAIPAGRPRVRQFDLAGLACPSLGSVLINGVSTCSGEGMTAEACQSALQPSSRTDVEVVG